MISKKVTQANPLLYNITLKIDEELSEAWLAAMQTEILPATTDGQIIVSTQINRLILEEEGEVTYAIQFIFATKSIFDDQGLKALAKFLELLDRRFLGKYVYFTTKMEILHYYTNRSHN